MALWRVEAPASSHYVKAPSQNEKLSFYQIAFGTRSSTRNKVSGFILGGENGVIELFSSFRIYPCLSTHYHLIGGKTCFRQFEVNFL